MEITLTGYVLILIGLYTFIFNRKLLYDLTIFFLPFTATAVINFGNKDSGSAIQPYMLFGLLLLLSKFLHFIFSRMKLKVFMTERKAIIPLIIFLVVALGSLAIPYYLNGTIEGNITGKLGNREPIKFTLGNITQYLYLMFGIFFSIIIYNTNKTKKQFYHTLKIFSYSMGFVLIWGIFQLLCNVSGIEYPSFLFNNSWNESVAHELSLDNSQLRISSVGAEPSIIAQTVLILIPFLLIGRMHKDYINSKKKDIILLIGLIIFIFISTSTIGIIGLVFTIFSVPLLFKNSTHRKFTIQLLLMAIVTGIIIFFAFNNVINKYIFEKGSSWSTMERLDTIIAGWDVFLKMPITGVGWGSVSCNNMFVMFLSSTGCLGLICIIFLIINSLKMQYRSIRKLQKENKSTFLPEAIIVSLIGMLFGANGAGFSFYFGFYWFIFGLSMIDTYQVLLNKDLEDSSMKIQIQSN